jgi:hypothetical protein
MCNESSSVVVNDLAVAGSVSPPQSISVVRTSAELVCCIAEDRVSCEPALRILVASLAAHCPSTRAFLFCPNASPEFARWLSKFPQATLADWPLDGAWTKYDIKPLALRTMLQRGFENVLWIDSDILVADDFLPLFAELPNHTIAVAEEALCSGHPDPDALRAKLWGMKVGRCLPFTANTGVIRVTAQHASLLERWQSLLESPIYREAQARPWQDRGLHVMGDQEVLTALLASAEFSGIPIRYLSRGRDIIQFFGTSGYTVAERLAHVRHGLPPFVHSQGFRPWWPRDPGGTSFNKRFLSTYNDLSPYTALARQYADELVDPDWLRPHSRLAAVMQRLVGDNAPLGGLPLALSADLVRLLKTGVARLMFRHSQVIVQ